MEDSELRYRIYRNLADTGTPPAAAELEEWCGGPAATAGALRRLHDSHAVVLDEAGSIRMALPFSAVASGHRVVADDSAWWANCAWDALAIPAALDVDATIEAAWLDTGEPVDLEVRQGELRHSGGFVHFAIPARHWWDDIVET
jgi:hypothetical protein